MLVFVDLYLATHKFHQGKVNPEEYYADRGGLISQMKKLRAQEGPFRIAQLRNGAISEEVIFPRNIGYLYPGYEALEGYAVFNMKEYNSFVGLTNTQARLDIQNVGIIAYPDMRSRRVEVKRYTNSLPRAKFYHSVRSYADTKAIYADLDAGRLDYRREVGVLAEDCSRFGLACDSGSTNAIARVSFAEVSPEEYRIEYTTTTPGVIFVSENFYPGWEANAGQYPMIRAFGAFKGIVVKEPGHGVITVKFSPRSFRLGLAITLTTLLVLLGVWLWMGGHKSEDGDVMGAKRIP
jgi:hypothetical protein